MQQPCKDCENAREPVPPPPQRPRITGPQQQAPPPTPEVNARQRNLRDQRELREWYPNHCTFHLFYHHVLQRPPTSGCTLTKEGETFCRQGGNSGVSSSMSTKSWRNSLRPSAAGGCHRAELARTGALREGCIPRACQSAVI